MVVVCVLGNRGVLAGWSKTTAAVAEVSEAVGNLAGTTADATVAVSGLAVEAVVVAGSAAEEAWRGVDVLGVVVSRTSCKAVGRLGGLGGARSRRVFAFYYRTSHIGHHPQHVPPLAGY